VTALRRLARLLWRGASQNLDLLGIWWVLIVAQPLVAANHWLAREDLIPWLCLSLSAAAFLRGRPLGSGHHPSLTPRRSTWDWWLQRLGIVAVPWVLMGWYDVGRTLGLDELGFAVGVTLAAVLLLWLGRNQGRTAWNPPGISAWVVWSRNSVAAALLAVIVGLGDRYTELRWMSGFSLGVVLGTGFLGISLLLDRVQNLRQRLRAGSKDGSPYRAPSYRYALAFVMPWLGLWALQLSFQELFGGTGYEQGYLAALWVLAWAAILWDRPVPVAVHCLLHEVVPSGGAEPKASGGAAGFDQPPEGALRINPLAVQRTRAMHPWLVPVQGARIGDMDDPVRALWPRTAPPLSSHVMGEASFEPDALIRRAQWSEITIRLRGNSDLNSVSGDNAQTRRFVVLRAFPAPGSRGEGANTYLWQAGVPASSLQVVDSDTESLSLRSGDVIVLSIEGVARAFELEIGQPVFEAGELAAFRSPQLEDYVGASG